MGNALVSRHSNAAGDLHRSMPLRNACASLRYDRSPAASAMPQRSRPRIAPVPLPPPLHCEAGCRSTCPDRLPPAALCPSRHYRTRRPVGCAGPGTGKGHTQAPEGDGWSRRAAGRDSPRLSGRAMPRACAPRSRRSNRRPGDPPGFHFHRCIRCSRVSGPAGRTESRSRACRRAGGLLRSDRRFRHSAPASQRRP